MTEKWSDAQDEEHPVRWTSKSGDETRYVTMDEALRRLTQYGHDKERARSLLLAGHQVDTMFAVYQVPA